jgi:hypothetical protein
MSPEVEARFEQVERIIQSIAISQAETQAIANSNARAIEATANQQAHDRAVQANTQRQLSELVQIVSQINETTNRRLTAIEDRH